MKRVAETIVSKNDDAKRPNDGFSLEDILVARCGMSCSYHYKFVRVIGKGYSKGRYRVVELESVKLKDDPDNSTTWDDPVNFRGLCCSYTRVIPGEDVATAC